MNIAIILAAGKSQRFLQQTPKQLHLLNNKPIINYSIETFLGSEHQISLILIVTNSKCYEEMLNIKNQYYMYAKVKIVFLINDVNCRIESINTALNFIKTNCKTTGIQNNQINIIIHDAARPFINSIHVDKLLNQMTKDVVYAQYYLKLVNGLLCLENHQTVNRDNYIEICTPLCINYAVLRNLMKNYINKKDSNGGRIYHEFIPILKDIGLLYILLEGHYNYLRKITTIEDLETY